MDEVDVQMSASTTGPTTPNCPEVGLPPVSHLRDLGANFPWPEAVEPGRLRRTAALDGEADIAKRCCNGRIKGTVIFCGVEGAVHSCGE